MYNIRENLQLLWDFCIVAEELSISSAADKIYTSQSNLSKRMQTLENNLNIKLFISTNKGITLTSDGEKLYKDLTSKTLNNLISLNNVEDQTAFYGRIVIGTTRNIADNILAKYLSMYMKKYPNVEIKIITDNASNLNNFLLEHKIDVLIDYLPQINFTEKYDFVIKAFSEFKTCFACNNTYYDKIAKNIKSLNDLNNYNLIIPGSSRRRQMLDEVLQKNNVELSPQVEMPDSKLMADVVKNGNYIGYFIENEVEDYGLSKINLKEEMPVNAFGIVYSKDTINFNAMNFINLI